MAASYIEALLPAPFNTGFPHGVQEWRWNNLLGDNSQSDPAIYQKLSERYADKIQAVFIRRVREQKVTSTIALLGKIEACGIKTCFYRTSNEALAFAESMGLVLKNAGA